MSGVRTPVRVEGVAGRELDRLRTRADRSRAAVSTRVGVDLRAARTLDPRGARELADHRDRLVGRRAAAAAPIGRSFLQQHHRLSCRLARERVVRRRVVEPAAVRAVTRRLAERATRATAARRRRRASRHARPSAANDDPRRHACLGLRARHLEVEAGGDRGHARIHRSPVRDHGTLEAPLVAQHLGEQPVVLRGGDAVDPVVRAHHGPRLLAPHDPLEGGKVDLAQRALVDLGAHRHPVGLLVVRGEVLEGRADPGRLQAAHPRGAELAGQQRVLGEVLEVATAQRRALDVDARAEQRRRRRGRAASSPSARPTRSTSSTFQLDASPAAGGKQVAGDRVAEVPTSSGRPPKGARRGDRR